MRAVKILDWLKRLFGGGTEGPVRRYKGDGICPYCGAALASVSAQQCFACGVDWHDSANVVQRGKPGPNPFDEEKSPPPVVEDEKRGFFQFFVGGGSTAQVRTSGQSSQADKTAPPQSTTLNNLDPGPFAPATRQETRDAAASMGSARWLSPWFGRRDVIPPASDQRTNIIDRAMVGQGMITPEELAEIHAVGDEMIELRGDLAQAHRVAGEAVARSVQDRERIKEQKKQEAAERKRRRQEEIARRRQTDIVFLGRGVSRGLADRRANVERLTSKGLPVLATPSDVAEALGVSIGRLRWLAYHSEAAEITHYIRFTTPKKSGGVRELAAPHRDLKRCQDWIHQTILAPLEVHDAAHGFVAGRSTVSGAQTHVGSEILINLDLEDFFPTINIHRVLGVFRSIGYSPAAATILALLCTESPRRKVSYAGRTLYVASGERGLPQGASTSPALSNLTARRLDKRLSGIASKLRWRYTRYADDITFSTSGEAANMTAYLLARARHIVSDEGFSVNEKKTRIQRSNTAQSVTGIVVNERCGVPRKTVRRLRAILHRAQFEGLEAQNRQGHSNFRGWVEGMVAYVSMVNPDQGRPLREALAKVSH